MGFSFLSACKKVAGEMETVSWEKEEDAKILAKTLIGSGTRETTA